MKEIVEALDSITRELSENTRVALEVDDYNMLAFIGENLWEIADTLKKIEAKMK